MGRIYTVIVILILFIGTLPIRTVDAQTPITILEQSLTTNYKTSATFHLKVASSAGTISKVRLTWHFRGNAFVARPAVNFAPAQEVVAEYTWPMATLAFVPWDYLFAKWEITDSAGNKLTTPDTPLQVTDSTRAWKELKDANIAVYTYDQPDTAAQAIMETARPIYDRMVNELGFTPPAPLGIVVYKTAEDLCTARVAPDCDPGRLALLPFYGPAAGFTSMWMGNDPAEFTFYLQTTVAMSMLNDWLVLPTSVNDVPTWLFMGLYERYMPSGQAERTQHVRDLAAQGKLLRLADFGNAYEAANIARDKARLVELQAMEGSTVTFIVDKVGEDGLMKMLTLMKSGKKMQSALKEVTGYDFSTFETAWSEWAGVAEPFVVVPTPTDSFKFPPTPTFPPKK
ncbi:MAG: hypothetical protein KF716_13575 [Anaerolineae bacterium]|nr:hypothetical protein [Anaerolineae bacterium]